MNNIEGESAYKDCGVKEELFPCMGKCCRKNDTALMVSYAEVCLYCRISSSLPCGPGLRSATIFECGRLGYGRRVTEE